MHRRSRTRRLAWALATLVALSSGGARAQATAASTLTLKQAFEAAWERQPEAASQAARREAAEAARRAASSWSAEPAALEVATKTDRLNSNAGSREYEVAVAVPLWLPGERGRTGELAEAERAALEAGLQAARLRVAAAVREAWWAVQRARLEESLARDRLANAQQLAADVAKRVRAGDLARSDQFQADSAVAQAEATLAEAAAVRQTATLALRGVVGAQPVAGEPGVAQPEAMPDVPAGPRELDARHPEMAALSARAAVSRKAAELAAVQKRANPELMVGTTRERGSFGDAYQQSITVGIRIPFGAGSRGESKAASARADALEAQGQLTLDQARLFNDIEAAQARVASSRAQLEATEKHARLAKEVRGFFEKSFRLGESDLPTRLRVELEALEADRQAARVRIDAAAAVSALRQALGLLPE
jgi:cobalt-zinc-cadmium efflux system outer membrane protein